MRALVRCCIVASLALAPATAAAQLFSGIVFERGDPAHRVGVQLGGALSVELTSRLALRVDANYVRFGKTPDVAYPVACCGSGRITGTRLELWSSTVNLRFMEQRDRNAFYWIAGMGVYLLSEDASRLGWNVGGGMRLSRAFALDVRYHQLIDAKITRSLVPVSISFRF